MGCVNADAPSASPANTGITMPGFSADLTMKRIVNTTKKQKSVSLRRYMFIVTRCGLMAVRADAVRASGIGRIRREIKKTSSTVSVLITAWTRVIAAILAAEGCLSRNTAINRGESGARFASGTGFACPLAVNVPERE